QLLQVEGLGQVVVGAALGRLHRGQQRLLRAHDDDRQVRSDPLDARQKVEAVFVGHHHVGDDQFALAFRGPAPKGCGIAGRPDLVADPPQCLIQHGTDRAVVVGNEDGTLLGHSNSPESSAVGLWTGRRALNTVRRGRLSHSITPPWSPMILATNASPRPVPLVLVVTKGSKRYGRISSGTPGPLSWTETSSGKWSRWRDPPLPAA